MAYIAQQRLYHTQDRQKIVEEGDPNARFLLIGQGAIISDDEAQRLGLTDRLKQHTPDDPIAAEEAALQAALQRGAVYEAQSRQNTVNRMRLAKGTPAEGSAFPMMGAPASSTPVVATPPYTTGVTSAAAATDANATTGATPSGAANSGAKKGER
jgi:hypothetical protein